MNLTIYCANTINVPVVAPPVSLLSLLEMKDENDSSEDEEEDEESDLEDDTLADDAASGMFFFSFLSTIMWHCVSY